MAGSWLLFLPARRIIAGLALDASLLKPLKRATDALCSFLRLPFFGEVRSPLSCAERIDSNFVYFTSFLWQDTHMLELTLCLRALFSQSDDFRYLAIARGLLQSLATHVADPCVPLNVRAAAEHTAVAALLRLEEATGGSHPATAFSEALPAPLPTIPAIVTGEPVNSAGGTPEDDLEALLARSTELGVPMTNEMRLQLCVGWGPLCTLTGVTSRLVTSRLHLYREQGVPELVSALEGVANALALLRLGFAAPQRPAGFSPCVAPCCST